MPTPTPLTKIEAIRREVADAVEQSGDDEALREVLIDLEALAEVLREASAS
jgi:hypothetical protein